MIDARLYVDEAVGETRRVLVDETGAPFRMDIERASEAMTRARVRETWIGRAVERSSDGDWILELGAGVSGLLIRGGQRSLTQGQLIVVEVRTEARDDKAAVVVWVGNDDNGRGAAGRVSSAADDPFLSDVRVVQTELGGDARGVVDLALEEAQSDRVELGNGARFWIERTRALTAVDVDRGSSREAGHKINLRAADGIARQLALRGIGGLVMIDFIGSPRGRDAEELSALVTRGYKRYSGQRLDSLGLSRFGVLQASIPRRRRDIQTAIRCAPEEREALDMLRELETLGLQYRGARFEVTMSRHAERWLRSSFSEWAGLLADRIGARWKVLTDDRHVGGSSVVSAG